MKTIHKFFSCNNSDITDHLVMALVYKNVVDKKKAIKENYWLGLFQILKMAITTKTYKKK